jgi:hypothetical protein
MLIKKLNIKNLNLDIRMIVRIFYFFAQLPLDNRMRRKNLDIKFAEYYKYRNKMKNKTIIMYKLYKKII